MKAKGILNKKVVFIRILNEQEIIDKYLNGATRYSLQQQYNIHYDTIMRILKKHNIEIRSYAVDKNLQLNENFFKVIDSPEKAYWLGFIITDGGIYRNGLEIALKKEDEHILHSLEKDLNISNHITIVNGYSKFCIRCKKICEDLKQYNVVPNKTFVVTFPQNIEKKLIKYLLRGMFDGDGGISIIKRKRLNKTEFELSFTGNYNIVEGFKRCIESETNCKNKQIEKNNSIFRIRWSSKQDIIKILDYLYSGEQEHILQRKKERYLFIKNT